MKSVWSKMVRVLAVTAFLTTVLSWAAAAQDEDKELGWFLKAELASVLIAGNSQSTTFGAGASARRVFRRSELLLEAGGTRTESTSKTRTAVGSDPSNYVLQEDELREKTAELYMARGRYDWNVTDRFQILGGIDWMRNIFAGIDSRTLVGLGAGNTWADNDEVRFKTNYSFTYTFEAEVVENPFTKSDFPGARLGYDFWWNLTETTDFESELVVDWNLDNTDDIRVDWSNALPVSISERLELKPKVRLMWRNDPALKEIPLVPVSGGTPTGKVLVPLEELDTIFTLALVVNL